MRIVLDVHVEAMSSSVRMDYALTVTMCVIMTMIVAMVAMSLTIVLSGIVPAVNSSAIICGVYRQVANVMVVMIALIIVTKSLRFAGSQILVR